LQLRCSSLKKISREEILVWEKIRGSFIASLIALLSNN
jgi:hypothetical protein